MDLKNEQYLARPQVSGELAKEDDTALCWPGNDMEQKDHADRVPDLACQPADTVRCPVVETQRLFPASKHVQDIGAQGHDSGCCANGTHDPVVGCDWGRQERYDSPTARTLA